MEIGDVSELGAVVKGIELDDDLELVKTGESLNVVDPDEPLPVGPALDVELETGYGTDEVVGEDVLLLLPLGTIGETE